MSRRSERSNYDADPRLPQGAIVLTTLLLVLAAGIFLIVRGML
jgi:hypothetical protein